jgi:hypothetical protein
MASLNPGTANQIVAAKSKVIGDESQKLRGGPHQRQRTPRIVFADLLFLRPAAGVSEMSPGSGFDGHSRCPIPSTTLLDFANVPTERLFFAASAAVAWPLSLYGHAALQDVDSARHHPPWSRSCKRFLLHAPFRARVPTFCPGLQSKYSTRSLSSAIASGYCGTCASTAVAPDEELSLRAASDNLHVTRLDGLGMWHLRKRQYGANRGYVTGRAGVSVTPFR